MVATHENQCRFRQFYPPPHFLAAKKWSLLAKKRQKAPKRVSQDSLDRRFSKILRTDGRRRRQNFAKKRQKKAKFWRRRRPSVRRILENLRSRESCDTRVTALQPDSVSHDTVAGFTLGSNLQVTGCRVPKGHSAGGGAKCLRGSTFELIYMFSFSFSPFLTVSPSYKI